MTFAKDDPQVDSLHHFQFLHKEYFLQDAFPDSVATFDPIFHRVVTEHSPPFSILSNFYM